MDVADTPVEREVVGVWDRLRRRKVVQWGLGYAAVAWAALQGVEYLGGTFDWPREIQRWATVALILALPIIATLAWYHGDKGEQRVSRAEFAVLAVLLLLGGGALWWFAKREAPADVATTATAGRPPVAAPSAGVSAAAAAGPSIAVLPFENRSRVEDDAFFVDGIHDDILTQLSKVSALKVISRTSVEKFRDTTLSTREIAGQLGVTSLLEGGVQRAGDRVRINVQLIDAASDAHLWAESYDRELTAANIFSIQSEVAAAIAGALKATLTAGEKARVDAVPTQNLEAWENYQLGRQRLAKRTVTGLSEAERYFQRAIELDPKFALAYAGLADTLAVSIDYADVARSVALDRAQAAADAALKLDPGLADAWASAALVASSREDYDRAEELFRRAIELNPNHAMALKYHGNLLFDLARIDESVRYLERAAELDPLSAIIQIGLGNALAAQERFEDAAGRYRRAIEIDPLMPMAYFSLSRLAAYSVDDFVAAVPLAEKAVTLDADNPWGGLLLAMLYSDLGDEASLGRVLRQATERWPDHAVVNVLLAWHDLKAGDRNGAERYARRTLEANPRDSNALGLLGIIDYREGRYAESVARYRSAYPELSSAVPHIDVWNYSTALDMVPALQKLGRMDEAIALLAGGEKAMAGLPLLWGGLKWDGRAPNDARALALRGRKQEALAALRAAERAGWRWGWRHYRDIDPAFDSIRDDPEFKAIFADIERDMARQRAVLAARPKDAPLDLGDARP